MLDLGLEVGRQFSVLSLLFLKLLLILVQLLKDAFLRQADESVWLEILHLQSAEAAVHLRFRLHAVDLLECHIRLGEHVTGQL